MPTLTQQLPLSVIQAPTLSVSGTDVIPKPGSVHHSCCKHLCTVKHFVLLPLCHADSSSKTCPHNRNEVTIVLWSCWVCVVLSSICIWCICSTSRHSQTTCKAKLVCWCVLRSGANVNCVRCASHQSCAAGTNSFLIVHV